MDENIRKLQELLQDEETLKTLLNIRTPEEVQDFLSKHDVELSMEDISALGETITSKFNGATGQGEIDEEIFADDLESVAGGAGCLNSLEGLLIKIIPFKPSSGGSWLGIKR